ncbi:hypothetical protein RHSP_01992 [Rhizobium freirei PRF 81]|uniref:Uncharacterized protein n=1 Tax=Rhizobium freirei PRF 81 TaxID=363754 RepID=N6VDC6_9HYPH|nr:hypothetical protein RHSP_01992 [Rhizobium freirei PRF 81]
MAFVSRRKPLSCNSWAAVRLYVKTNCGKRRRIQGNPEHETCGIVMNPSAFRQGDEFFLVARHDVEAACAPFFLGLFDALLGRGHEIPPDIALRIERRTSKKHEMTAFFCGFQGDGVAGAENEKLVLLEAVAGDDERAGKDIDGALLMRCSKRKLPAWLQLKIDIERIGEGFYRRGEAFEAADHHPSRHTAIVDDGQVVFFRVGKGGIDFFPVIRECQPCLQARHGKRMVAQIFRGALGMHDAAPGRHQVDVAGADDFGRAEAVEMTDFAVEQIGDGGKPDVRMRAHVERFARPQDRRPHAVEEDERPHQPPPAARKRAPHRKTAKVAGARNDEVLDRVAGEGITGLRIVAWEEGHIGSPFG